MPSAEMRGAKIWSDLITGKHDRARLDAIAVSITDKTFLALSVLDDRRGR